MGQLMTMTSLFVVTWIGLTLIGIPGALVLGFITGLLSFIPNVGAVLAGTLIVLASLGSGGAAVAGAFGLYLLVQFLEGNILTPLIQRHAIDIPPATLFAAQIFLGFLFGLWGLALALPLIAITNVVLKHFYPAEQTSAVPL
jgi:predicted PurR-regulated permease PerM